MPKPFKHDPQWAKAKRICRLNQEDIQMAKELGMTPKSLMKNNPSPSQAWKLPVKLWIRELHERRFEHGVRRVQNQSGHSTVTPGEPHSRSASAESFDEDVPF